MTTLSFSLFYTLISLFYKKISNYYTMKNSYEKDIMIITGLIISFGIQIQNLLLGLHRSPSNIDFIVPEYTSIETFNEIYKTNSNRLSLHELCLLANQYDPDSPQFREIIEKATEVYPNPIEYLELISQYKVDIVPRNTQQMKEIRY